MSEKKYPRRSDSRNRNGNPELILETDIDVAKVSNNSGIMADSSSAITAPSAELADEEIPYETFERSRCFGNEFTEIRERFFRVVDRRPDMKPHDLKCILWDMLPPYEDEYPSECIERFSKKIDTVHTRLGYMETCLSTEGNLGLRVNSTMRKADKIWSIAIKLLELANGEVAPTMQDEKLKPIARLFEQSAVNSENKLREATDEIITAVNNADKNSTRLSVPVRMAAIFGIAFLSLFVFQCAAFFGYLFFHMSLSDLGWLIWIAPVLVSLSFAFVANDKYLKRQKCKR